MRWRQFPGMLPVFCIVTWHCVYVVAAEQCMPVAAAHTAHTCTSRQSTWLKLCESVSLQQLFMAYLACQSLSDKLYTKSDLSRCFCTDVVPCDAMHITPCNAHHTMGQCDAMFSCAKLRFVPCCGVPSCGMPCYAMLCCAMLCCAILSMLCHAGPCCTMLGHAASCCAMLFHAVPCWAMLRHAVPCRAMLCSLRDPW